ncbi:unnamed protein product [Urochloa humidicola]
MHMLFLDASSGSPAAIYLGDMLMLLRLKNLHLDYIVPVGQGNIFCYLPCLTILTRFSTAMRAYHSARLRSMWMRTCKQLKGEQWLGRLCQGWEKKAPTE